MNGYLEALAHWMDDILERRRMGRGGEGMTDIELKPCPFCGGEQEIRYGHTHCYIMCARCHTKTRRFQREEEAVGFWNDRRDME